ncbi:HlyD family type I secretion periplasmic adaptor subunit [Methylobacterium sp. BTF04]|uniref:HlyD family type I secretion periplasmic adaptor subunit n=1 Tax=Methylobacterium sp. BTF04 TaxID=2708300 RepID=UPI0013D19F07|nr:HlyD family type I secretion periplasmic adaptor subunit [Methylobacterium sp. BTF04]NEU12782.1 HlyD family type I secretion periplasmic adaptor subunit [Methylobacterium sp. BTF04]
MKPSDASAKVVPITAARLHRSETEFLPAALEIIETPASPLGRIVALSIAAFLTIAIVWASLGEVDIVATAQGRVIPTGKSKVVQPYETGVVRRIAVADGSTVKAGDILVELDPTTEASDEARSLFGLMADRLDIVRLQALLADDPDGFSPDPNSEPRIATTARRQMEAQAAEHRAKLDGIDRRTAQKRVEGREIGTAIEKFETSLPLITEQRDIRRTLLANQYGSRLTYLQVQQQLVEGQHELTAQRHKQDENGEALAVLEKEKAEAVAGYRKGLLADLAKAELSAVDHGQEIRKAALRRGLRTLRAPVDGTVQQSALHTLGGIVTPAQTLMVIVPKDASIEIEATLLNKDVGFVRKGQPVEVKVETFTFTRYGLLHGHVSNLSHDVVTSQDAGDGRGSRSDTMDGGDERDRQARQPSYVAHVALPDAWITTEEGRVRLEPGMAVTAEIKTGRRSVISYLLSPLVRLKQEGLRER